MAFVAIAAALTVSGVTPALAQAPVSPRAFSGLFGGNRSDANVRQKLDFTVSLSEAYDSDLPAGLRSTLAPASLQSGYSTMFVAAADYAWHRPRAEFGATASSALRYYPRLDQIKAVSHSAALGLATRLPKRTTLLVNQTAAYSPSYLYQLFPTVAAPGPGDAIPAAPDYDIDESESYSYGTRMTLTHGSNRGNRVAATGEFDHTEFQGRQALTRPDLTNYGLQGQFSHGLARNAGVSVGYHYRTGEFGYGGATTEHRISIGMDYSRPLSITRRAVFRFNVASSSLDIPESAERAVVTGRLYRFLGDFALDYQFRRTWQARANYRRGLDYVAALGEPVFADGATVAADGLVARRAQVSASAGYARGESALNRNRMTFDTYTGDARLRYALTQAVAVYAEYLYYFYDFRGNTRLAPGIPARLERNGVRAGLMLWVPALRR